MKSDSTQTYTKLIASIVFGLAGILYVGFAGATYFGWMKPSLSFAEFSGFMAVGLVLLGFAKELIDDGA